MSVATRAAVLARAMPSSQRLHSLRYADTWRAAWYQARALLHHPQVAVALLVIVPMALAALIGAAIALGSTLLTLMAVAVIVGPLLLFVPTHALLGLIFAVSFFGAGLATYYGHINQAHWLPYVLCLWLWMKLPMDRLARRDSAAGSRLRRGTSAPLVALTCFFVVCIASTVLNTSPILSFLVGSKNYLVVWSVTLTVASGLLAPTLLRHGWLAVLAVAAAQAPFTLAQHFSNFSTTENWDTVVGSFGGDPEGAGQSGAMVIFISVAAALLLALWRRGQLKTNLVIACAGCMLVAVGMAEVKAFFVLAPLGISVVLIREVRERPAAGLLLAVGCAVALSSMFIYYKYAYFDKNNTSVYSETASDYLDYMFSVDGKLEMVNRTTGEVSRMAAPLLWNREVARFGPDRRWLGFGLRASRNGNLIGPGEAARHFAFTLTTSTVTALLWDIGLLGLLCMVALLVTTGGLAWRLSAAPWIPDFDRACLEASAGACALLLLACIYNDSVIDHYACQVLLAFIVGYVVYWHRFGIPPGSARAAGP